MRKLQKDVFNESMPLSVPIEIRWGSVARLAERISKCENLIRTVLVDQRIQQMPSLRDDSNRLLSKFYATNAVFWLQLNDINKVLQPVALAIKKIEGTIYDPLLSIFR